VEVKGAEHLFITVRQACSFYRVAEAIITVVGNGKIELFNLINIVINIVNYYGLDCDDEDRSSVMRNWMWSKSAHLTSTNIQSSHKPVNFN
jgi:hypothetical protein